MFFPYIRTLFSVPVLRIETGPWISDTPPKWFLFFRCPNEFNVRYLNAIKYTLFKAQITKYPIYSCYILLHPVTSFYCNVMRIYAKFDGSNSDSSDSSRLEAPKIWWESSQWVTKNHMTNFVNHWNVSLIFIITNHNWWIWDDESKNWQFFDS